MIDPNTIRDGREPEATPKISRMPIEQSTDLEALLRQCKLLQEALLHDAPVKQSALQPLREHMKNVRLVMGTETFSPDDMRMSPILKRTIEVWQEIREGFYKHHSILYFLNDDIARILVQNVEDGLHLDGLHSITTKQAEILAGYEGDVLTLIGLDSLGKDQATALANYKGKLLYLNEETTFSKDALQALYPIRKKITGYANQVLLREKIEAMGPLSSES